MTSYEEKNKKKHLSWYFLTENFDLESKIFLALTLGVMIISQL